MRIIHAAVAAAFAASTLISGQALAVTATGNLKVKIKIKAECTVAADTENTLDFGEVSFIDNDLDVDGSLTVRCTKGTDYTIGLGDGENGDRTMDDGASNSIAYELYSNSDRDANWGTGGSAVSDEGNGAEQTHTVYGRVPAPAEQPPPGDYEDTVAITVTY